MTTFAQLLNALPPDDVIALIGDGTVSITAPIAESTSTVGQGGIFVARQGKSADGHDFIPQAIANGAVAIIGEKLMTGLSVPYAQVRDSQSAIGIVASAYYGNPSRRLIVIGVTGTDGKTTTTTLIHSILKHATGGKTGYISTIAAELGSTTADTGLHVTTPTAPEVQMYMAQMVEAGLTHCVIEMTSHGLAQGRLAGVDIDVAVMTNVTHEHLDYHGSFEAYRDAKGIMFDMLASSYEKFNMPKIAVVNADDLNADYFSGKYADKLIRYGITHNADVRGRNITYTPSGAELSVITPTEGGTVKLHLLGQFNVLNALAAVSATIHIASWADIRRGLADIQAVSGRMERIDEGQKFTAIVDFAHTPNALKNALTTAKQMLPKGKRLIAIFGSAGLRDVEKRRMMAETSVQIADMSILTAEDPRTESLDAILEMMAQGAMSMGGVEGQSFIRVVDRGEALFVACQMAQAGDIVIACGKGHEQSMCFGTVEYPWDDRDAMRAALRGTPLKTLPTAKND
ncbi:MAG: UDP-N-acetylmuramoyl-L-alanyl-D-glutamate--2,6-diaminopimelate ligase [Phototrophicales bacterium]|nr:UDP-N-acetylmuramoyl-L-alanyl-D-glutamate--2,6-diaminopimelate ligase [Phototrophicales bacterium]